VSTGREFKGAVAPAEESVRVRSRLGEEENDAWKGEAGGGAVTVQSGGRGSCTGGGAEGTRARQEKQRSTGAQGGRQRTQL
jgi:hypothetical protein